MGIVDGVMPTGDAALQELLLSMLEYGSDAQTYLGYRTDTLANEFYLTFGNSETPTDGVEYDLKADGTVEVTGYNGSEMRVVIARKDSKTGRRVTSIRAGAFRNNGTVTEVVVPETVKTIGDGPPPTRSNARGKPEAPSESQSRDRRKSAASDLSLS